MAGIDSEATRYSFGDLVLDSGQRRVWRDGELVALPRLSFEFLLALVESAPNVVSHDEMAARVWGGQRIVTPENQAQRLLMLRRSLGDSAAEPVYVESVRGQGFRLIPPAAQDRSGSRRQSAAAPVGLASRSRPLAREILGIGLVGVLMVLGLVGIGQYVLPDSGANDGSPIGASAARLPNSIAVLPFQQLNAPSATSYFAEAVHAELVNELGRRTDLNVIGRASVLHYDGSSLPVSAVADELGVENIVKATVTYAGDEMHLVAELIDAETGLQRWRETYDAGFDELFSLRLRLTNGIGKALDAGMLAGPDAAATLDPSDSGEAYAYFLRAMDIFGANNVGTRPTAQTYLDQAIALDPEFAHAYAGKALVHVFSAINSGDAQPDGALAVADHEALAIEYIEHALELDPQTDLAHYAAGVLNMFSWRFREARAAFSAAVALSPQDGTFLSQLGWLEVCGLGIRDGLRYSERAAAIDPQNAYVYERLSAALDCAGDRSAALAATERALALDPTSFASELARAMLVASVHGNEQGLAAFRRLEPLLTEQRVLTLPAAALAYARLGQVEDARRLFQRFTAIAERRRTGPANRYMAYLAVNDYDRAYEMLEQAVDQRQLGPGFYTLIAFLNNPGKPAPFGEPRFVALRDRLRASARAAQSP